MTADDEPLFAYVLKLAKHEVIDDHDPEDPIVVDRETLAVARWVQRHIRKVRKGEYVLPFLRFKSILTGYNCTFVKKTGNRMDISRGGIRTQIFYSHDGMEVEVNTVHMVRRELGLDEAHGYDSEVFYHQKSRIPEFISKYRKILERLGEYDRLNGD
jgi:hypothetical protein